MPTPPYEPTLNRDPSKLPRIIPEVISPWMQEVINYATNFYQRCQTSKECASDECFPSLASYLHIIQMTDSIEVLISHGCPEPAKLLLRSSFEAGLAVGYLLKTDLKRRSLSWMVKNILDQIEQFENLDASNLEAKDLNKLKHLGIDEIAGLPQMSGHSEVITKLKESLKRPGYSEVYAEYQACVTPRRRYPEWYSLFKGPYNLKQLAKHLNKDDIFQSLYASWSRMSHVSDTLHLTLPLEDGTSVLGPIRNPLSSVDVGVMAASILLETTKLLTSKYKPYESTKYEKWFGKDILPTQVLLIKAEIGHAKWFEKTFMQKK
jgi:hypothetical protein